MGETALDRLRDNVTEITTILVTGLWLALLFVGPGDWWLAVMLVGYVVVVPIVAILAGDEEEADDWDEWAGEESTETQDETPLETLQRRYAEGELTDEQFERKLERLLEVETLEDAEDWSADAGQREPALERE